MSDRELLEAAAKAYGATHAYAGRCWGIEGRRHDGSGLLCHNDLYWNPLTDDGDALRLAVKLCIELDHNRAGDQQRYVAASRPGCEMCFSPVNCVEDEFDEPQRIAATRRAIVRAAAEIGRAMP